MEDIWCRHAAPSILLIAVFTWVYDLSTHAWIVVLLNQRCCLHAAVHPYICFAVFYFCTVPCKGSHAGCPCGGMGLGAWGWGGLTYLSLEEVSCCCSCKVSCWLWTGVERAALLCKNWCIAFLLQITCIYTTALFCASYLHHAATTTLARHIISPCRCNTDALCICQMPTRKDGATS